MKKHLFAFTLALTILSGCGDDKPAASVAPVPQDSKIGWTQELIHSLIACQPYPGEVCECVIPKITTKYTPDQVKEKSPFVAADMLTIKAQCEGKSNGGEPNTVSAPKSEPTKIEGSIETPSIPGEGCETGAHKYESFAAFCEGLQNESLNNNCALEQRREMFKIAKCPGNFTPTL